MWKKLLPIEFLQKLKNGSIIIIEAINGENVLLDNLEKNKKLDEKNINVLDKSLKYFESREKVKDFNSELFDLDDEESIIDEKLSKCLGLDATSKRLYF